MSQSIIKLVQRYEKDSYIIQGSYGLEIHEKVWKCNEWFGYKIEKQVAIIIFGKFVSVMFLLQNLFVLNAFSAVWLYHKGMKKNPLVIFLCQSKKFFFIKIVKTETTTIYLIVLIQKLFFKNSYFSSYKV